MMEMTTQELLEHHDPALSEWKNMKANGYDRVWDCGTRKLRRVVKP